MKSPDLPTRIADALAALIIGFVFFVLIPGVVIGFIVMAMIELGWWGVAVVAGLSAFFALIWFVSTFNSSVDRQGRRYDRHGDRIG